MAKTSFLPLLPLFLFLFLSMQASGHNITAILESFPDYSLYNSYLTQTKVCDEINTRETVTCLVLTNSAMSSLSSNLSLPDIKNELRLLTLLDYFDPQKLHSLSSGSTLTTTLYQTTGDAAGDLGHVNVTNLRGGKVGFASTAPGSHFDSVYTKSVKQFPYNLSILEVSAGITFPGLFGATSNSNLTALLIKAGCKQFASLIESSGVIKMYEAAMDKGLTLFAPNDDAFKAAGAPDLSKLTSAELVAVLQYHALTTYSPKASLKGASGPLATMASNGAGKYDLKVSSSGDEVNLATGVDTSRVASTILDVTPVCVMTVDSLLLPWAIFGGAPTPAPAPGVAEKAPAPAPAKEAPASAPAPGKKGGKKKKKAPGHSPPAPPMESPDTAPSDAPAADAAADKVADSKNSAESAVTVAATMVVGVAVSLCFAMGSFL